MYGFSEGCFGIFFLNPFYNFFKNLPFLFLNPGSLVFKNHLKTSSSFYLA